MSKWRVNEQGLIISPEGARSEFMLEKKAVRKKRHKTNKFLYTGRKLHRFCPKCNAEITKKKRLSRNDALGVFREQTVYICDKCNAIWASKQTNKVWKSPKKNPNKMSNKQFKQSLRCF